MCYSNCEYETYPYGVNEVCVCSKSKYDECPKMEEDSDEDSDEDALSTMQM